MSANDNHRRTWLRIGLGLALVSALGSGGIEAKKKSDEGGGKCEGTKKQRKQKIEKRELTEAQLDEMIEEYERTLAADREAMKETLVRRVGREYEQHLATGEPYVLDILIVSGGGAKGAFGAGFLGHFTQGFVREDIRAMDAESVGNDVEAALVEMLGLVVDDL